MEIKEIKPVTVFYTTVETTLKEINKFIGKTPDALKKEADELGLEVIGPQIWCYNGSDGNPDTKFMLDISFPVMETKGVDQSRFKKLDTFKCASTILNGSWDNFKQCYEKLIGEIFQNGYTMGSTCREVYINCDFENPENNITEVQIGIN